MDDDTRNDEDTAQGDGAHVGGNRPRRRGRPVHAEVQPRRIVAVDLMLAGASQKEIATRLEVSEKTVGR